MVLTDYSMPEMTGYDLLKAIKVHHHTCIQYQPLHFLTRVGQFICACISSRLIQSSSRCKFHGCFPGADPPEADTGGRHVVRERAPADQQVPFLFNFFLSFFSVPVFVQS